jgi:sulfur transfer protein SufE
MLTEISEIEDEWFYDHLLEFGQKSIESSDYSGAPSWDVIGCQSQVTIKRITDHGEHYKFFIDSDSFIVKGLGAIVAQAYAGCTEEEILEIKFEHFKPLAAKLTHQRKRGLQSIINKIHEIME